MEALIVFVYTIFGFSGKDEFSQALQVESLYIYPGVINWILCVLVLVLYYKIIDKPSYAKWTKYLLFSLIGAIFSIFLILIYLNYAITVIDYNFTLVNALFFALTYNIFFYYFFFLVFSLVLSRMSTNCRNIPIKWWF